MNKQRFLAAWGRILTGKAPMLSIEITRECPLHCPGCYAYGDQHLGGEVTLRQLNDLHGDALVEGVLSLVQRHDPVHLSIVGGEPLIRHRELSRILPVLSGKGIETLVVTSAVIPFPAEWNALKHIRVAVSVDGLQPDHDARRQPATYEKILHNIAGHRVDISWVITRPQMERAGYLDEYLSFWCGRPEVDRIWLSIYTPQKGERSAEMLTPQNRTELVRLLPELKRRYPALIMTPGMAEAFARPPANPDACVFSKMSVNYSADFKTRIEPCFFGGNPDCSQCGCAVTAGLEWVGAKKVIGPLHIIHLTNLWVMIGSVVGALRPGLPQGIRWRHRKLSSVSPAPGFVQIQ